MPANDYYDSTGAPATNSSGQSSVIRAEFDAVEAGFNKLPALTGNGNRVVHINAGGTAMTSTSGFTMSAAGLLSVPNGLTVTAGATTFGGSVTASPANANVTVSPSGTGTVTISPATVGSLDNMTIGASTPKAITATALTATGLLDISGVAAGQVKFPSAQNASADANTLDDYEEGTWQPGISFGGASVGVVYNQQTGYYRKIGAFVFCSFLLDISDRGSSAGNAKLTGLPFSDPNGVGFVQLSTWVTLATACISVSGLVDAGATTCSLTKLVAAATTNNTFLQNTDIGLAGSILRGIVIFKV